MKEEGLTVRELVEELQKLPQDNKIYVNRWYKREGSVIEWGSYFIRATGIREAIDIDTNKTVYSIETECTDLKATIDNYMKGLDYE